MDINLFSDGYLAKIFSHFLGFLLSLETVAFAVQELYNLMQFCFYILDSWSFFQKNITYAYIFKDFP
jgi:hypothetical protein